MPFMKEGRPAKIEAYVPMINDIVRSLGVNVNDSFDRESNTWFLKKGSASVTIQLFTINYGEKEKEDFIEISSLIKHSPKKNLTEFYKRLLELND